MIFGDVSHVIEDKGFLYKEDLYFGLFPLSREVRYDLIVNIYLPYSDLGSYRDSTLHFLWRYVSGNGTGYFRDRMDSIFRTGQDGCCCVNDSGQMNDSWRYTI
jgi:hypothetical protein